MARPLRIEYEGAFYHVISRGNERKDIFIDDRDRKKFLSCLEGLHLRYGIKIHTYCVMNNHYHLILETPEANLTKAMHTLNTSYTVYFNHRYKRCGHLFQGRYKSILVQADGYLHHLSRYIHLNPIRAGITKRPKVYTWSSCRYFTVDNEIPGWLSTGFILSLFNTDRAKAKVMYEEFVLQETGKKSEIIRENITAGFILGNAGFVEWVRETFLKGKTDKEIPQIKRLEDKITLGKIENIVKREIKGEKLFRKLGIYFSCKYTGRKLNDIAEYYGGISDAGVSQIYYRTERRRKEDRDLSILIKRIEKLLNVET